jgi:hypothetical protein
VWVTGYTSSTNFPLQSLSGAYNQGTYGGGLHDAFILKFNTSGVRQWATYYGGTGDDGGYSIHSDGASVWVTGYTYSTDFPLQSLPGAYNQGTLGGASDAFILNFSTSGVRQWATYYGGTGQDEGRSIHSDGTSVWVTGYTHSTNFPLQSLSGAYNQGTYGGISDAFILDLTAVIGIKRISTEVPSSYKLYNNYPNPFNPSTNIKFDVTSNVKGKTSNLPDGKAGVKLIIYDVLGREVEILVNQQLEPGTYKVDWNASNYPSGVYFYRLTSGNFADTKKMVLVK